MLPITLRWSKMVEKLGRMSVKSKLDLRSGFWQAPVTERGIELKGFVVPYGRVFRWCCMPFGLQGALGTFQELMGQVCNKTPQQNKLKFPDLKLFFLGAFFDDVSVGNHTEVDHIKV